MAAAAALLPADPALPHLRRALDGEAMAGVFGSMLQPHGLQVAGCIVDRIKYRPRRNCSLSYRLALRDPRDGRAWEQRVAARLCNGDAERRALRAAAAPLVATPAGPALRLLPELELLTWWWPNDARLAAPRLLADEARLRAECLPALLAVLDGRPGAALLAHGVQIVQYVPEQRLTARVSLRWRVGGEELACTVYAKASGEPDGALAHARLAALQASPAWCAGRLATPAALLWQPEAGLHWQQAVAGRPWGDENRVRQHGLAPALGAQLAALHASAVQAAAPPADAPALQARLDEVVAVLHDALPEARGTLADAAAALAAGLDGLAAGPAATLHGDLHPRNVLVDRDSLALIDLDGLHRGPAALELGAWAAEGIYHALLDGAAPMRDARAWQALIGGYTRAGGTAPAQHELAFAAAWSLLTQRAWRSVVNLKPGRFAIAPALVAQAARLARTCRLEAA